jgi:hypothetical protein
MIPPQLFSRKKGLQICGGGTKSRKRPTLVVGKKPNGQSQFNNKSKEGAIMYFNKETGALALLITGMFLAVNLHSQSFITNGLIAYYPFNGNANDASGNGNNGTFVGASPASNEPTLTSNHLGVADSAYSFSSGSYVFATVTNLPLANSPRTISAWVNLNASSNANEQSVASWGYGNNTEADSMGAAFGLWVNYYGTDNGRNLYSWGSFQDVSALYDFQPNIFYFVADTYDGNGNVTLFVNGVAIDQESIGSYNTFTNSYLLRMGKSTHVAWNNDFLNGSLDSIRIYNRALSSNEIAQLYAIESGPALSVVKAVTVQDYSLFVGSNYQLQVSSDLVNWTNQGPVFTATSSYFLSSNYWIVADWNQLFFRLLPQ